MKNKELYYTTDEMLAQAMVKCNGDKVKAYMEVFPEVTSKYVARAFMQGKLKSHLFRRRISELLDKQGLHIYKGNEKLKQLLEHKSYIVVDKQAVPVADGATQARALEMLYKLHGVLGNDRNEAPVIDNRSININLDGERMDKLKVIVGDLVKLQDSMSKVEEQSGEVIDTQAQPVDT